MEEDKYLASLEHLAGKVVAVTGGTSGIGLYTARERAGVEEVRSRIQKHTFKKYEPGPVHFHALDLGSVESARASAEGLKEKLERLDILVANAAFVSSSGQLTSDGYDKTFAVNCLGHFVFVNSLLDVVKSTANTHGEARITITASNGYKAVSKLNYDMFTTPLQQRRLAISMIGSSFQRYLNSKLGTLYFAMELDRRLREAGVENVLVNAAHPGQAGKTSIGDWDHTFMSPSAVKTFKRFVFLGFLISHTNEDAAKTQTYISASKRVSDEHIHGELWVPTNSLWPTPWSWMRYTGSVTEKVQPHAADKAEWKRFWDFCDEAVKKAEGGKGVSMA